MAELIETEQKEEQLLLVGVSTQNDEETKASLDELEELAQTAGGVTVYKLVQNREAIHPSTYVGKGKLDEIKDLIEAYDIDTVVCE